MFSAFLIWDLRIDLVNIILSFLSDGGGNYFLVWVEYFLFFTRKTVGSKERRQYVRQAITITPEEAFKEGRTSFKDNPEYDTFKYKLLISDALLPTGRSADVITNPAVCTALADLDAESWAAPVFHKENRSIF